MKRFLALLAFLFLVITLPAEVVADPVTSDESFREALTYFCSCKLYWRPWLVSSVPLEGYQCREDGKALPSLGKKLHGVLMKQGDVYCLRFKEPVTPGLESIALRRSGQSTWRKAVFEFTKPYETVAADFEFEVPLNFLRIASAFDDSAKPMIEKLSKSLASAVEEDSEAAIGTHHFFLGPFTERTPLDDYRIYWVERKEFLELRPLDKRKDLAAWGYLDFKDATLNDSDTGMFLFNDKLKDSEDLQLLKTEIERRFTCSNHIVANCVRDGKLITVVKRPPSAWSKFKAWLKAKFKPVKAENEMQGGLKP